MPAATIVAEPDEAGLRAAISSAQAGDVVVLGHAVELQSTLVLDKPITLTAPEPDDYRIFLSGSFTGELCRVTADGVVLDNLRIYGSPQTDGVVTESKVLLKNCLIRNCRRPVLGDFWSWEAQVVFDGGEVSNNDDGVRCSSMRAMNTTFSFNRQIGVGGRQVYLEGCRIESNQGAGLALVDGTVRDCVFRFNSGYGLLFDPDPGTLNLEGCLFYANTGIGLYLGEEAYATIDNCTFTRHTGQLAIKVSEAHQILFRHCTVADNVWINDVLAPIWETAPPGTVFSIQNSSHVELQNCLVADNPTSHSPHQSGLDGDWVDGGGNVIGIPAHLSVLEDQGGPTLILRPLPDSPAIDAGHPSEVVRDARGLSRWAGHAPDAGAVEAGASAVMDQDKDGLPDTWERLYHLDPHDAADAISDNDEDGKTAWAEYLDRTNPTDAHSLVRLESVSIFLNPTQDPTERHVTVQWRLFPGARHQLESSTDMALWRALPGEPHPFTDQDGLAKYTYTIRLPIAADKEFYRLVNKESE